MLPEAFVAHISPSSLPTGFSPKAQMSSGIKFEVQRTGVCSILLIALRGRERHVQPAKRNLVLPSVSFRKIYTSERASRVRRMAKRQTPVI